MLHLPAGVAALAEEVEADQDEGGADGARVRDDVLRTVGVYEMLVDELAIASRDGVGGELAVELPTFGRGVVARVGLRLGDGEAEAATGAVCDRWARA